MDCRLELVSVPVTDVDRAKAFYTDQAGFVLDHDHRVSEGLRFVQVTPPGSACSIAFGTGLTESPPGSAQLQVVVDVVHDDLQLSGARRRLGEASTERDGAR